MQTGDEVRDIVNMAAVAALDAADRVEHTNGSKPARKVAAAPKAKAKVKG
jgi:hypothetical protein